MASLQPIAGLLLFSSFVLVSAGHQEFHFAHAAGTLNRLSPPPALAATDVGHSAALADCTGYLLKAEDDDADQGGDSRPTAKSSPPSSSGSAPVGSSTTGSHTVRGGRFPSQPLNFPPEVNQGPGWTVPQGPYRPLPSRPPESSTKEVPE